MKNSSNNSGSNSKLVITHGEKIIYPQSPGGAGVITKADVLAYYRAVGSVMVRHHRNRPLIMNRFPEGIRNPGFYQREVPKNAPDWIARVIYGKEIPKNYIVGSTTRTLLWLANLDVVEFHQTTVSLSDLAHPDQLVFDLDPSDGGFEEARDTALMLQEFLAESDIPAFAKTSGGRGIHLVCPIEPIHTPETVVSVAKNLIRAFLLRHPGKVTLEIRKEKRQGRLYIDLFRNHTGQGTVCAYSLRARPGATVSMPVTWEALKELADPSVFNLRSAPVLLKKNGDPWQSWDQHKGRLTGRD